MDLWNVVEKRVNNGSGLKISGLGPWVEMVASSSKSLRDHSYVEENDGLMCFREQSFITSERRERVSLLIPRPRARPAQVHMLPSRRRTEGTSLFGARRHQLVKVTTGHRMWETAVWNSCIVQFLKFVMIALIGMLCGMILFIG